jgi:nucleotide-binding universal stress UspA family protein
METVEDKSLEDAILSRAANMSLVVMATRGHDSVLDVLRGSHTDRVLHRAHCPVLSVPV